MSITPDFDNPNGLLPAIIQNARTGRVLMLGYMSSESYTMTLETGLVTFFSRSRNKLWVKGETSGNYLKVLSHEVDCDRDALLFQVVPEGPTCHRKTESCFDP